MFKQAVNHIFNLVMFLALAFVLSLLHPKPAKASCYSDGVRQGVIQKFSSKGFLSKSWEGEMVQAGVRGKSDGSGNSSLSNIWKFSVTDAAVAKKLEEAMFDGGTVTVKYCKALIRNPLATSTPYEVTDVRVPKVPANG